MTERTTFTPNPLRILGVARVLAGGWFVATGAATLRQYHDLAPMAQRIFWGEMGKTDAPIRSLLVLIIAPVVVMTGFWMIVMGFRWIRRLEIPAGGPSTLEQDEVVDVLTRGHLPAFADGPTSTHWLPRRLLADQLADMTWWRRQVLNSGVRTFVRACALVLLIAVVCLWLPYLTYLDLTGPFPTTFVIILPFVTGVGAALGLMLMNSEPPRTESIECPVPTGAGVSQERVIETQLNMLDRESPSTGIMLGIAGVAVQCIMLAWWNLSDIGYPLLATSMIRHTGSIAGGILFFVIGGRMLAGASQLLMVFRYESLLVLIEGNATVARAAAIRTESRGLEGPRHIVAAVGGVHTLELAERVIGQ